jgi:hypothetical protein
MRRADTAVATRGPRRRGNGCEAYVAGAVDRRLRRRLKDECDRAAVPEINVEHILSGRVP